MQKLLRFHSLKIWLYTNYYYEMTMKGTYLPFILIFFFLDLAQQSSTLSGVIFYLKEEACFMVCFSIFCVYPHLLVLLTLKILIMQAACIQDIEF